MQVSDSQSTQSTSIALYPIRHIDAIIKNSTKLTSLGGLLEEIPVVKGTRTKLAWLWLVLFGHYERINIERWMKQEFDREATSVGIIHDTVNEIAITHSLVELPASIYISHMVDKRFEGKVWLLGKPRGTCQIPRLRTIIVNNNPISTTLNNITIETEPIILSPNEVMQEEIKDLKRQLALKNRMIRSKDEKVCSLEAKIEASPILAEYHEGAVASLHSKITNMKLEYRILRDSLDEFVKTRDDDIRVQVEATLKAWTELNTGVGITHEEWHEYQSELNAAVEEKNAAVVKLNNLRIKIREYRTENETLKHENQDLISRVEKLSSRIH